MRVLNGMMSYEDVNRRWDQLREEHPGVSFDSFRWLQQLDNANYHPGFRDACKWLLEKDRHLQTALDAVVSSHPVILEAAKAALSGKHEWGKVAIDGLLTSPVVQTCLSLLVKETSTP
jgi:hypothetical protein